MDSHSHDSKQCDAETGSETQPTPYSRRQEPIQTKGKGWNPIHDCKYVIVLYNIGWWKKTT